MPSVDWSGVAIKVWDALTEHPKLVTPACSLFALAFWVAIWREHPTGALEFGAWFAAIVLTGAAIGFPVYGWSENSRLDSRLRTATATESGVIQSLVERNPSLITWEHDPRVAGLLQDGILEKLPNSLQNGLVSFGLTRRAQKRALKAYPDTIV